MMKNITSLFALLLMGWAGLFAQAPTLIHTQFATGFSLPVSIAHCGDDRIFVVEQRGKIKIVDQNGVVRGTPFLDIDSKVINSGNERGLLGLAFHPDYKNNGHFFVYYSDNSGGSVIARYSVSAGDTNLANNASELILLSFSQPYSNHNGGCLQFGSDGYLYISTGDGGSAGDPQSNGQKKGTYLGKMLRLDVDGGTPYVVPASNPFVGDPAYYPEIWALGLRNPWRFSFDRVTGDLWIGDVGQNSWEEIDYYAVSSPAGANFGWKCKEGTSTYSSAGCAGLNFTDPIYTYTNNFSYGCSVTGGYVYRGGVHSALYGYYVHADYCSGRFWITWPDGMGGFNTNDLGTQSNDPSSFGEDAYGELYYSTLSSGKIFKLSVSGCSPTAAVIGGNEVCAGNTIELSTPANPDLTYQWFFNGSPVGTNSTLTVGNSGNYYVVVTNSNLCASTSDTVTVTTIAPPTVAISSPQTMFFDNDPTVTLTGSPAGGTYSGPGVTAQGIFDPAQAGLGTHQLIYTYTQEPCAAVSDTVEVVVSAFVSIDNPNDPTALSVSPNPANDHINLSFTLKSSAQVAVEVIDMMGKVVLTHNGGQMNAGLQQIRLNTRELPSGNYIVRMVEGSQVRAAKITLK